MAWIRTFHASTLMLLCGKFYSVNPFSRILTWSQLFIVFTLIGRNEVEGKCRRQIGRECFLIADSCDRQAAIGNVMCTCSNSTHPPPPTHTHTSKIQSTWQLHEAHFYHACDHSKNTTQKNLIPDLIYITWRNEWALSVKNVGNGVLYCYTTYRDTCYAK